MEIFIKPLKVAIKCSRKELLNTCATCVTCLVRYNVYHAHADVTEHKHRKGQPGGYDKEERAAINGSTAIRVEQVSSDSEKSPPLEDTDYKEESFNAGSESAICFTILAQHQ